MRNLTIGELAKAGQVNIETIRYYERRGLLPKPPRTESGYRQFPLEALEQIKFIKNAKELGFSLKEILELLSLKVTLSSTCEDVRMKAESKIEDIDEKISSLLRIKEALQNLTMACINGLPASECQILKVLGKDIQQLK